MSEKYYYQHEDTGRCCCIESPVPPSNRWYSVSKEFYDEHEAQANNAYTGLAPTDAQDDTGSNGASQ